MSESLTLTLSDAAIKRHLFEHDIYQLRDEKLPLVVRYNTKRTQGSWFVVKYAQSKAIWRKIGTWPALTTKAVLKRLPDIQARLAVDVRADHLHAGHMTTSGQVLIWYLNRCLSDRNLSPRRKASIKTFITKHLMPKIGLLRLTSIDRSHVDSKLIWPLQAGYSLSTVRQILSVMKLAFKRAEALGLIDADPCAGMKFSDFITTPIVPKGSRIRTDQLPSLLTGLSQADYRLQLLVLLMLMHGTRVGETRQAKWRDFDLAGGFWHIPAKNTKTGHAHRLPLTAEAIALVASHKKRADSLWLFPGKGGCISDSTASRLIRDHADKEWSAHDLRKAARTVWADIGIDYMVGEILLNHALSKMDKTYIHTFAERQTKAALVNYHQWLCEVGLTTFVNHDNTKMAQNNAEALSRATSINLG